jgi:hypothetical protein
VPVAEAREVRAAEAPDALLRAEDRARRRVPAEQELVGDIGGARLGAVGRGVDLLDHDAALLADLVLGKGRPRERLPHEREEVAPGAGRPLGVVRDGLVRGLGVRLAAQGLDGDVPVPVGAGLGALEAHVLEEVRQPGFGLPLEVGAAPSRHEDGGGGSRVRHADDLEARWQNLDEFTICWRGDGHREPEFTPSGRGRQI